MPETLE